MRALTTAGLSAGVGSLISGTTALSMALDGAFERFLVRRGVRRPLLVMGATGLVVGWALKYFDADSDDEQPSQAGAGKHRDDDRPSTPRRASECTRRLWSAGVSLEEPLAHHGVALAQARGTANSAEPTCCRYSVRASFWVIRSKIG